VMDCKEMCLVGKKENTKNYYKFLLYAFMEKGYSKINQRSVWYPRRISEYETGEKERDEMDSVTRVLTALRCEVGARI